MRFSVIIPVYNAARYLRDSLDTLCSQTFGDWEAICVDDGSDDESASILEEYARRDKRLKVVRQSNAGVSAARNRALDVAQGEYVLFLDADDGYAANALAVIDGCLSAWDCDLLKFCADEATTISKDSLCKAPVKWTRFDIATREGAVGAFEACGDLIAWNACYRRSTIGTIRFESISIGEDSIFGGAVFAKAERIAVIDSRCYQYRQHDASAIHVISLKHILSEIESCRIGYSKKSDWRWRGAVRRQALKRFRNSFLGKCYGRVLQLPEPERNTALQRYFDVGELITRDKKRYHWIFRLRSRALLNMFVYAPFKLRVLLLEFGFIRRLKATIRRLNTNSRSRVL